MKYAEDKFRTPGGAINFTRKVPSVAEGDK
jgi:hypothetical protein